MAGSHGRWPIAFSLLAHIALMAKILQIGTGYDREREEVIGNRHRMGLPQGEQYMESVCVMVWRKSLAHKSQFINKMFHNVKISPPHEKISAECVQKKRGRKTTEKNHWMGSLSRRNQTHRWWKTKEASGSMGLLCSGRTKEIQKRDKFWSLETNQQKNQEKVQNLDHQKRIWGSLSPEGINSWISHSIDFPPKRESMSQENVWFNLWIIWVVSDVKRERGNVYWKAKNCSASWRSEKKILF